MWWKSPYRYSKLCDINTHEKKLIHCVAIFTILYDNYYPPHGEFKLISIGKFARRTWVNFSQQYGKNRQRSRKNKFYYAVWQLLLYYHREFPWKIFSVCTGKFSRRTWVKFTQQYGKNRQTCQEKTFYYAVWQLSLYYYREFP